jgi:hypothetical protein
MPNDEDVRKWVQNEKQSQPIEKLWKLNSIYLRTFLDFPQQYEFSIALLFIVSTWLVELLAVVFYLCIQGEFGGGKTVTGEVVVSVCRHGYLAGDLSPAFVARAIQDQKIALMIDEFDSFAGTRDSVLSSILRQGYRRGVKYSRVNPNTFEIESFEIFGSKLIVAHGSIEAALQTRTPPIHVRETQNIQYPIVNINKESFSRNVYTENFLWYIDNILNIRDKQMRTLEGLAGRVDAVDIVDVCRADMLAKADETLAEELRQKLYVAKKDFLTENQLSQLSQLSGRNVELAYICFALSNITNVNCDDDIAKTFAQKSMDENERTELGSIGALKEVLINLWKERKGSPEYTTEAGYLKVGNKEIYDKCNAYLKTLSGRGVSPSKFKGQMHEFGFTAEDRVKLKVPTPADPEPKSRLCNIFTDRVLKRLGVQEDEKDGLASSQTK